MSNDFFSDTSSAADFTRARAAQVNDVSAAVEASFDLLPTLVVMRAAHARAVSAGGTGNAITITNTFAQTTYTLGNRIAFLATATNTAAVTVNVDGLGVKSLKSHDGTALPAGGITSGSIYEAIYNGTEFRLSGGVLAGDIAASAASAAAAAASASAASTSASQAATAKTNAETAETNAELAETNAEAAQVAAEAAQAAAEAAALPSQTSHSGKFLTTNGTTASWAVPTSAWVSLGTISAASLSGQTSVSFTGIDAATYPTLLMVGAFTPSGNTSVTVTIGDGTDTTTIGSEGSINAAASVGALIEKADTAYPMCIASIHLQSTIGTFDGRIPQDVSPVTTITLALISGPTFNNAGGLTLYGAR